MFKEKEENGKNTLYQIRVDFEEIAAISIRNNNYKTKFLLLFNVLKDFDAELVSQYDAFKLFTEECEKDKNTDNPLYRWTKDVINNQSKIEKYKKSFTVYVKSNQLYDKDTAYKIKECLIKLNYKEIMRINIYNSDPKNNPQPPSKYY
tara:strand:- start:84 stop:527 length:444 start_codon:yes stop_codon:yes gene_type:complete